MAEPTPIPDDGDVPGGWTVHRFAEIDSTNRWLLDRARAGAPDRSVAVADHQTAGRGRLGRTWEARPGSSLLVSVLLRPAVEPGHLGRWSTAVGLALLDALAQLGVEARLKWPNDLVVGDAKLAGVLAEADLAGGEVRAVVVGAGVNLRADAVPAELAATATACETVTGVAPDRDTLLVGFLAALDRHLADPATLVEHARERSATLGRQVRVELGGDRTLVGEAVALTDAGELVVRAETGTETVVAVGDVVHLRPLC